MILSNYHSHTHYCDGHEAPENYVKEAIRLGLKVYGYSGHGPVPFDSEWNMTTEDCLTYIKEIEHLKKKYQNEIEVLTGLEMDYLPGLNQIGNWKKHKDIDYVIGSVHYLGFDKGGHIKTIDGPIEELEECLEKCYDGSVELMVRDYYALNREMIIKDTPDIIGHLDKIKMHLNKLYPDLEKQSWYLEEIRKTLDLLENSGVKVEINTRGIYRAKTADTYPSDWIISELGSRNIPLVLNSDAHRSSEILGSFNQTQKLLISKGIEKTWYLDAKGWHCAPIR